MFKKLFKMVKKFPEWFILFPKWYKMSKMEEWWSNIMQFLSTKSSKWVGHNQVSCSSCILPPESPTACCVLWVSHWLITLWFDERKYDPYLINIVKRFAAGGYCLTHQTSPYSKVGAGDVPSQVDMYLASRLPPAETAVSWRCDLLIKFLTPYYKVSFLSAFILQLIMKPSDTS